ncbi:DUF6273 domain-containing protein [Dysosmobacter sp.]|uniref:DUF6273 domain-containing protein n=1 Tax=Dysosmobacter sp. TaxID=2591382 RepID=UPI003A92B657
MIYIPPWQMRVKTVRAGDLPVGSVVKLIESGAAVEYLVVNQGIPSNSNLYDASCDGTWLLRKDIHSNRQWNSSNVNRYESSAINTWLNGDFFNTLGSVEQSAIREIKIPYCVGNESSTVNSGANGLSTKIFLLSGYEVAFATGRNFPVDGAKLSYFESGTGSSALNKRIAYLNGSAAIWWLRSQTVRYSTDVWSVVANGIFGSSAISYSYGIRPALILPSNALFDKTTMLLKGVK